MHRRKGSTFVFIMVLASSLLLLLSAFGVTHHPIGGAKRFQVDETEKTDPSTQTLASESSDKTGPDPTNREDEPSSSDLQEGPDPSEVDLVDLPIKGNDPDALPAGGESLRLWPAELALPLLHAPDLTLYYGQATASLPLQGITVILDASRGGADTGAVWGSGPEAVMEKTLLLQIAEEAEKALAQMGATVIMTRTTDEEFSLFRTVAKAADVALIRYGEAALAQGYRTDQVDHLRLLMSDIIRINQNSPSSGGRGLFGSIGTPPQLRLLYDIESQFGDVLFINLALGEDPDDANSRGCQAYYMSADFVAQVNNGYAAGQDAQTLAPNYSLIDSQGRARLASLLKSAMGKMGVGLTPQDGQEEGEERDMAVLRLTNYVSASFVPGYLSNEADRLILTSEKGRENIGKAMANAVLQYYVTAQPSP